MKGAGVTQGATGNHGKSRTHNSNQVFTFKYSFRMQKLENQLSGYGVCRETGRFSGLGKRDGVLEGGKMNCLRGTANVT